MLKEGNSASQTLIEGLRETNERLQKENDNYVDEVKELKEKFEREGRRIKREAEIQIRDAKRDSEEQVERAVGLMSLEINLCEAIKDRMLSENKGLIAKLKEFATILRIPRRHNKYIEEHGVDELIDFCEDIVKRERANIDAD